MTDTAHLTALVTRLAQERGRLATCKPAERELRAVWVRQCEKEINGEEAFLGMEVTDCSAPEMSIDEIMAGLEA